MIPVTFCSLRRPLLGGMSPGDSSAPAWLFAFVDLALNRLEMHVAPENTASLRVASKLGFLREGIARESELLDDRFRDHIQLSLLRSDLAPGKPVR